MLKAFHMVRRVQCSAKSPAYVGRVQMVIAFASVTVLGRWSGRPETGRYINSPGQVNAETLQRNQF